MCQPLFKKLRLKIRLGQLIVGLAKLLRLTREGFYYDSLCSSHYNNHGVFCTDTCNTVPAVMIEMLICSSPGLLEFLPALPPSLTQGSISGVKGRNRVTVGNLSWDLEKHSVNCILKSDIDRKITVIERDGIESFRVKTQSTRLKNLRNWSHGSDSATVGDSPLGEIARTIQLHASVSTTIMMGLGQLRMADEGTAQAPGQANPPLSLNRPAPADGSPGVNVVAGGTRD